jgi:Uma2 family endonuclease
MTYEQFLACYEGTHAEWVDGWIVPMSPVGREHQRLGRFLFTLLHEFVEAKGAGEVFYETFQMRLVGTAREPDLLFVATEHAERIRNAYLDGPADIAVEIISPESRARDRGEKFYEYEQAGVREYWLIDPDRRAAEFYALDRSGVYRACPLEGDVFRSTVLEGFRLRVGWLWDLPPLREALADLGLR